ncbi:hypothetical protein [Winogradskyella ludwigii]|uniref:hypothetical protein n=1 Tax=Winogradskyella ludwigii TaxID=2686076 RepID=UPI0015CA3C82|nr:hypothetical protein [Winogradskyella ludwigii]
MKLKNKSIFNLIEIFINSPKKIISTINTESHCAQKHLHDYYCDAEKPFVSTN